MPLGNTSAVGNLVVALLGDISKFDKTMATADKRVASFGKGMEQLGTKVSKAGQKMSLAITAPLVAIGTLSVQAANESARLQTALEGLAGGAEGAAEYIDKINEVSLGTISNLDAMAVTTKALTLGVVDNADAMAQLVEVAITLGRAQGLSATKAVDDLTTALGRQSPMILDNLGISLKLSDAYTYYAEKLGKTADKLTDAEKKQAFLNAALDKGTEIAAQMGGIQDDNAAATEQLAASMNNLRVAVGTTLSDVLVPVIKDISEALVRWKEAWDEFPEEKQQRIIKILMGIAAVGPAAVVLGSIASGIGKVTTAVNLLWASNPAGVLAILLGLAAAAGPHIADWYQSISNAIQDLIKGQSEAANVTEAIVRLMRDNMAEMSGVVGDYLDTLDLQSDEAYAGAAAAIAEIFAASQAAESELVAGTMRFDEALLSFENAVDQILADHNLMNGEVQGAYQEIRAAAIAFWRDASNVAATEAREIVAATGLMVDWLTRFGEAGEQAGDEVEESLVGIGIGFDDLLGDAESLTGATQAMWGEFVKLAEQLRTSRAGTIEYAEAVSGLRSLYAQLIAATKILDSEDQDLATSIKNLELAFGALGIQLEETTAKAEVWGTTYRDTIASSLSSIVWEILDHHNTVERMEQEHEDRMEDIREAGRRKLEDMQESYDNRIEDENRAHAQNKEDIERWYWKAVEDGQANTQEKKAALDAEYQEKMADALFNHNRRLSDIEFEYARDVEQARDDIEQAKQDEIDAYDEAQIEINEIVEQGFKDMVNSIVQSGIDTAIQNVIDGLWDMAFEAENAVDATNTALGGINLGPLAAFAAVLGFGSTDPEKTHKFGQDLDDFLRRIFGIAQNPYADGNVVRVPSYAAGGIVPGPYGKPQAAIVHGGEPWGAAGFAEAMDYERLGNVVAAGVIDGLSEMQNDTGAVGKIPSGDALARALWPFFVAENQRRGGGGLN